MKKILLTIFCALCIFSQIGFTPILAEDGIVVIKNVSSYSFPSIIDFKLSAQSDDEIIDVRLCYQVERDSFADVTSEIILSIQESTSVDTYWLWDLRKIGGLPPGVMVSYWWVIKDSSGERLETEPVSFEFNDNRMEWEILTEGNIRLLWYEGDDAFAAELMETAQEALVRLEEDMGAGLKRLIDIYIYADAEDLQSSMIFPQEWTGGVAFTRYGTIAIGIAPYNLEWGKRAVTHELAHLVTHQMTFNPYGGIPTWLNEGISMYAEGRLEALYRVFLNDAIDNDTLISVRSIASPFSTDASVSYLSYAESYSFVDFLIREYGKDKLYELLNTFAEGSGYDEALEKVYGFDMDGLDGLWREWLETSGATENTDDFEYNPATIGLFILVIASMLAVAVWLWRSVGIEKRDNDTGSTQD